MVEVTTQLQTDRQTHQQTVQRLERQLRSDRSEVDYLLNEKTSILQYLMDLVDYLLAYGRDHGVETLNVSMTLEEEQRGRGAGQREETGG